MTSNISHTLDIDWQIGDWEDKHELKEFKGVLKEFDK